MVGDQVDDPAPRPEGQVVTHADDGLQARPGIARAVAAPPVGWTIRSRSPWMTSVGTSMWRSSAVRSPDAKIPASCADDARAGRVAVPRDARRTRAPAARRTEIRAIRCGRTRHGAVHRLGPRSRRRGVTIRRQVDSRGPAEPRRTGGRHDRRQRANPARIVRGDGLGDHPAHRDADQVRVVVAERVQQADGVARHVAEVVLVAEAPHAERDRVRRPVSPCGSIGRRRGCRTGSLDSRVRPAR